MVEQENKIGSVWVIAEQMDCRLLSVSTQPIGQARKLADQLNNFISALVCQESNSIRTKL
jgi:hypothetical protein